MVRLRRRRPQYSRRRFGQRRTRRGGQLSRSRIVPLSRGLTSRQPVHSFVRSDFIETITASNLADTFKVYTFALNKLPNYTEFTNLFDQYRICAVKLTIIPSITQTVLDGASTSSYPLPEIRSIIDYTEDGTPLDFDELYQYATHKMTRGNRIHTRYFKPAVLTSAFEGVAASAYIPKWKQWLTTDDSATPHYSIKVGLNAVKTANTCYFRVYAKYYLQMKNIK